MKPERASTVTPWRVFSNPGADGRVRHWIVRRDDGSEVCRVATESEARLIASAPDLLAGCEAAMRAMREVRDSDPGYGGIVLRPSWTDAWDAIGAALRRVTEALDGLRR